MKKIRAEQTYIYLYNKDRTTETLTPFWKPGAIWLLKGVLMYNTGGDEKEGLGEGMGEGYGGWWGGGIGLYIGVACKRYSEDVDSQAFTNMVMFAINRVCVVGPQEMNLNKVGALNAQCLWTNTFGQK